jgi:hypothetical protein
MLDEIRRMLVGMFAETPADELRDSKRTMLKRYFRKSMGRRPMILPVVWENLGTRHSREICQ